VLAICVTFPWVARITGGIGGVEKCFTGEMTLMLVLQVRVTAAMEVWVASNSCGLRSIMRSHGPARRKTMRGLCRALGRPLRGAFSANMKQMHLRVLLLILDADFGMGWRTKVRQLQELLGQVKSLLL
jgi:hypothetical protein